MAVYKVPQDVEADDKLIGPFSFRQFIYLIVVAISMAGAWGLSQVFIPLAIIPLPIIFFFAALALPLRKDQPMEAYLSAVFSFYFLKPRKRYWIPDGIDSFVTIIPPKDAEKILTKELNEDEATRRLSYLAQLVDSHGWAIRGAGGTPDTSISTDLYYESASTVDIMDNRSDAAKALSAKLDAKADQEKKDAIAGMKTAAKKPAAPATKKEGAEDSRATATTDSDEPVSSLPTIDELRKKEEEITKRIADKESRDALALANALVEEASGKKSPSTSVSTPDTGTMELTREQADELSKQPDLSVQTIAEQANRVAQNNKKLKEGDEVTISLR